MGANVLLCVVDTDNTVSETNEFNNLVYTGLQPAILPLTVSAAFDDEGTRDDDAL